VGLGGAARGKAPCLAYLKKRTLAHRSAGAQRLPLVDYLLGAAAQHTASAVLHYDHDFDTLAEIMGFESIWLAPAGSIS